MIETYGDIKELIEEAMHNFRRNNLLVIRGGKDAAAEGTWRIIQISVSGADVWRRVLIPGSCTLEELHRLIQICLEWKNSYRSRFLCAGSGGGETKELDSKMKVITLWDQGITELLYEYGVKWTIKVILLSPYQPERDETIRCVAGAGAPPPEEVAGPLRFRRIVSTLESGSDMEKRAALHELGPDFIPGFFDMERCNLNITELYSVEKSKQ
jgi:hypothetical protein